MVKNSKGKIIFLMLVTFILISTSSIATMTTTKMHKNDNISILIETEDIDPLVDLEVTVTVKEIRALDKIDSTCNPDFYVRVFINDEEFESPVWKNQKYLKPDWSATCDVPDNKTEVNIKIQLWDWNTGLDKLCDISKNDPVEPNSYDIKLLYNLRSGHWYGDDYISHMPIFFDPSGYGRLNGCDDNSIYERDMDCEMWFEITQTDFDGDGIPYYMEVYEYNTDPEQNDTGMDYDCDEIPIEWEHKWGYDPKDWDDHRNIDLDVDGLDNVEEYLTSQWGSDPFRKDLFLEIDQMEIGPNGEGAFIPAASKDLLTDAYDKHNVVYHFDDGCLGGGQIIPFNENVSRNAGDLQDIYFKYFLNNDSSYWRRGVFHYAIVDYYCHEYAGFVFGTTDDGENYSLDSFQISTKYLEAFPFRNPIYNILRCRCFNKEVRRAITYAGAIMHETGHTLGIFGWDVPGCDNHDSIFPNKGWLKWRSYKSVMNYNYAYFLIDYSDGSHGKNDHDDWGNIDLTFFQTENPWH